MKRIRSIQGKKTHRTHASNTTLFLAVLGLAVAMMFSLATTSSEDGSAFAAESSSSSSVEPYRQCGSEGTLFRSVRTIDDARSRFVLWVSDAVEERQTLLSDPSTWQCEEEKEPTMEILTQLARNLPAWYYRRAVEGSFFGTRYENVLRPVTFNSFSSILGEFLREYECTLTELQSESFAVIAANRDFPPETKFCCTKNGCAAADVAGAECSGEEKTVGQCPESCPFASTLMSDLPKRLVPFHERILVERDIARTAVERTILGLRSYELEHETLRQLSCFERISLDLLNQTALLSEAASCLPKIWDAATSLHDRKVVP